MLSRRVSSFASSSLRFFYLVVVFPLPCVKCHPRSPGRMLKAAACASLEIFRAAVKRSTVPEDTFSAFISNRSLLWQRSEGALEQLPPLRVFLELAPHRFRTDSAQKLSRRHSWTAFSHGTSCATPPCARFGLYQKTLSCGHVYLAVLPPISPVSTCRDAFVTVAYVSLNGEESGTVTATLRASLVCFGRRFNNRKTD